jgi:hypothetical protein
MQSIGQREATHLDDAGTGGLGEAQSAHTHLGHLIHALIVSHGANNDGELILLQ